jgi:hypothetical protein
MLELHRITLIAIILNYHTFMFEHLFNYINIPKKNVHIPKGLSDDIHQEALIYESIIDEFSGVDLQLQYLSDSIKRSRKSCGYF